MSRRIRGIRDKVGSNVILGRRGSGKGPVQELKLNNDGSISVSNSGGSGGSTPRRFDVGFCTIGVPDTSALIWQFSCAEAFAWGLDAAGSQANAVTAPSGGDVALVIKKNGSSIGTLTFPSGVSTGTFVTGGSAITFAAGDILTVHTPSDIHSIATISALFKGVPA